MFVPLWSERRWIQLPFKYHFSLLFTFDEIQGESKWLSIIAPTAFHYLSLNPFTQSLLSCASICLTLHVSGYSSFKTPCHGSSLLSKIIKVSDVGLPSFVE